MTERTLRNWRRTADRPRRGPGRPKAAPAAAAALRRRALREVARVRRTQGRAGEATVLAALRARPPREGPLPTRAVRAAVREWNAHDRAETQDRIRAHRISIEVRAADVLWSEDATQLGVAAPPTTTPAIAPQKVHAEVVRDVGSCTVFVVRGGPPSTGLDVIRALVRAARAAGRWSLVFVSDNGAPYKSLVLALFLAALRIVHLRNEPRTPQHNAWSERGMRELKATARLAARPPARRLAAFGGAAAQLNRRPRLTKNNLTALELRRSMCAATALVDRETFYRAAGAAMTAAVPPQAKGRARRRAERAAIFATLEQFDLIIRYRGGVRITPRDAGTIT